MTGGPALANPNRGQRQYEDEEDLMDAICERCGFPAGETARIELDDIVMDVALCAEHLGELLQGARPMFPAVPPRRS